MDVEIVSMEPNHLRSYKLCILDQLIPAAFAPIVIYYPNHEAFSFSQVLEKLAVLKKSLSEILTRFFPLAGMIKDDFSIDCDDQGACFTTAKVKSLSLSEFLENPDLKLIAQLLPCELNSSGSCVTNIQASVFECGGIAIGLCISHRIMDGNALSTFLKSWAEAASSSKKVLICPDFSASAFFPANDLWLKDAAMTMWGSLFKKASLSKKPSLLTHIVNLRKRASPNFSEVSLGNLIWMASAKCTKKLELSCLVDEVKKSISRIDGDYVKKLQGNEGSNTMQKYIEEIEELGSRGVDYFGFTSWCKLGFYEVDFGWGKPMWVSSIDSSGPFFMNLAILMDTRCGNGIEAWVTLDEQEMAILECKQEFRNFASLNPSPLNVGNDGGY